MIKHVENCRPTDRFVSLRVKRLGGTLALSPNPYLRNLNPPANFNVVYSKTIFERHTTEKAC